MKTFAQPLLRVMHDQSIRDAVIIMVLAVVAFAFAAWTDLFEELHTFAAAHDDWQVDEIFILFIVLSFAGLVYAIRRVRELRAEVCLRRSAEERAQILALHDALTGLPNRRYFQDKLRAMAEDAIATSRRLTILMLDLDGFKPVNDFHGHPVGDLVLIEIANRLTRLVQGGIVARLGGDEFAIILSKSGSPDETIAIARRAISAIEEPVTAGGITFSIGACIGISFLPDNGTTPEDLIRRADLALYRAKAAGRSTIRFFEEGMDAHIEKRLKIEGELRKAIAADEIVPFFQPLVSLDGERIVGFEALARWDCPGLGPIAPEIFIPVAEECGLIATLGDQLLRKAALEAKNWPEDVTLSFNISPIQLRDHSLGVRILSILSQTGLNPSRLEIEITESALVDNIENAQCVINQLRGVGVRTALDDFGTGYATLSQLLALNLDKIKIDRSFVQQLITDPQSLVIVRAVIGLANGFGLTTTAEGVENAAQLDCLKANGCIEGQGYLFGRALPASEAGKLVHTKLKETAAA